jgi:hypothetical protein
MAAITSATLIAAHPEWTNAPAAVLAEVILVANSLVLDLYTDDDQDTMRRHLEASAMLYESPFARDMAKTEDAENPYRKAANRRDVLKGVAYRAPGWTLPAGVS